MNNIIEIEVNDTVAQLVAKLTADNARLNEQLVKLIAENKELKEKEIQIDANLRDLKSLTQTFYDDLGDFPFVEKFDCWDC